MNSGKAESELTALRHLIYAAEDGAIIAYVL